MNNDELMELVRKAVSEAVDKNKCTKATSVCEEGEVEDISAYNLRDEFNIPNAYNPEEYKRVKAKTDARLGVWRSGPRPLTRTTLRVRADNAAAMDAVFDSVSEDTINEMGLFSVTTACKSKDEYLTRPDLGRMFTPEAEAEIKSKCVMSPDVQIIVSDGLSSTSIECNARETLPAILQGLKVRNIKVGTPFFVKYGRVGCEDHVAKLLDAKVTVILIGERPGLATAESMSAYCVWKGYPGIPEANRTVISNIHKRGTPAVEAGAYIAELCETMLKQQASGLDLKG